LLETVNIVIFLLQIHLHTFQELIDQVKAVSEPRFADVVFFLYDLAGKGADDLIQLLKRAKRKASGDNRSHDARVLFSGDARGITILSEPSSPLVLRKKLLPLAEIAKFSKHDAEVYPAYEEQLERIADLVKKSRTKR